MKVRVRLFGVLGQGFPDYDHQTGMEIEIPEGSTVGDLLDRLGMPGSFGGVVACGGRLLAKDGVLEEGAEVGIFQSVFGG